MKALSALRQVFSLKKNEELGGKKMALAILVPPMSNAIVAMVL